MEGWSLAPSCRHTLRSVVCQQVWSGRTVIRLVSRDVSWAACTRQKHTVVARAHLCVPEHFVCKALEGLTLCLSGQVSKHSYVSVHLVRGTEFIGTAALGLVKQDHQKLEGTCCVSGILLWERTQGPLRHSDAFCRMGFILS